MYKGEKGWLQLLAINRFSRVEEKMPKIVVKIFGEAFLWRLPRNYRYEELVMFRN
jgi:hypothetical protein